jgi:hypothetical protein
MVHNTQNYWVFGLNPSSGILKTGEHIVSETESVSVLRKGETSSLLGLSESDRVKLIHAEFVAAILLWGEHSCRRGTGEDITGCSKRLRGAVGAGLNSDIFREFIITQNIPLAWM